MDQAAHYYSLLMAIMVLGGGVMGFVKAKSKASLISGSVFGILLAVMFAIGFGQLKTAVIGSFVIYLLLDVVFAIRLAKTKKFMPAGMILIFCVIGQVIAGVAFTQLPG